MSSSEVTFSLMCKPSEIPFYCRLGESKSLPFNAVEQRSSLGLKYAKKYMLTLSTAYIIYPPGKCFISTRPALIFTFKYSN